MKSTKYEKIADQYKADRHLLKNTFIAFITGGFVGLLGEGVIEILMKFGMSRQVASTDMIIIFILAASLFTALGFFDKLVMFCKSGLIIPITGFAHSMTSSSLDVKSEGPIYGIGSNMFKLAGSVIIYGIVSAWFFGIIRYLIEVIL